MSNSEKKQMKAAYTTPTLVEYGSLSDRTRIFGQPTPNDISILALTTLPGATITSIS